ncbi:MAG: ATP phosphoribosyltransferase regulatory subunit [Clostridia bacterium]|nr:ATP phosphoribosyltransferase regulatory subunit [Clostridia bacterium]
MKTNNILKSPAGVGDIYGADCVLKTRIEERLCRTFESFGYSEIQTPSFEYMDVFEGDMSIPSDEAIKFIDSNGRVLALRPDITTSISRAVAAHFAEAPLPLRLWYVGSVYRGGESYKSAKKREFTQAGVELIGVNTPEADAEVIALTINSLLSSGLKEFQIELSHSDFLRGIVEECGFSAEDEETLRELLDKKFSFGVEEFCASHGVSGETLRLLSELPSSFGDGEDVLYKYRKTSLNAVSRNALNELEKVFAILKSYSLEQYITIDLGQVRSFPYYTGVIFRGLTAQAPFPICGGGRYDTLCRRFSLDLPATGVAVWVDRLADALLRSSLAGDISSSPDAIVFYPPNLRAEAYEKASLLRSEGKKTVLDVCHKTREEAILSAKERNIDEIYFVEADK